MKITISNPCEQNWEAMPSLEGGRHCLQCDKVIYDFSFMSDEAVLNFFQSNPLVHCGRFHNDQLNKEIAVTAEKKHWFPVDISVRKSLAVLASLLLFKSEALNGLNTQLYSTIEKKPGILPDTIVFQSDFINGIVYNDVGKPLPKVLIYFNEQPVGETDSQGMFKFFLPKEIRQFNNITFKYDGYVTAVRSYHQAMLSTEYSIHMQFPSKGRQHTMGIMIAPMSLGELPSLNYKSGVTSLNKHQKRILDLLSYKMKSNPGSNITINAYCETCGKSPVRSQKRLDLIKKYLVVNTGIAADRVMTNIEVGGGNNDTVDIVQQY